MVAFAAGAFLLAIALLNGSAPDSPMSVTSEVSESSPMARIALAAQPPQGALHSVSPASQLSPIEQESVARARDVAETRLIGFRVYGEVQATDGRPVAQTNIQIDVYEGYQPVGVPEQTAACRTDDKGGFDLLVTQPRSSATIVVTLADAEFDGQSSPQLVFREDSTLGPLLILARRLQAVVFGTVTAADGVPISDAEIGWNHRRATTASDGNYRFPMHLCPYGERLEVRKLGYVTRYRTVSLAKPGEEARIDIVLEPEVVMTGHVRTIAGRPIQHARVEFLSSAMPDGPIGTTTDANGWFALHGLHRSWGFYMIQVEAAGFIPARLVCEAALGGTPRHDVVMDAGTVISGIVLGVDGVPLEGASVLIQAGSRLVKVWSGRDGRFTCDMLPPGTTEIIVVRRGYAKTAITVVVTEGGSTPEVRIELSKR